MRKASGELRELRRELIGAAYRWDPVDEALARWCFLPWWKRLLYWLVSV